MKKNRQLGTQLQFVPFRNNILSQTLKQQVITANKENCAVTRIACWDQSPLAYAAPSSPVPARGAPAAAAPAGGGDAEPGRGGSAAARASSRSWLESNPLCSITS